MKRNEFIITEEFFFTTIVIFFFVLCINHIIIQIPFILKLLHIFFNALICLHWLPTSASTGNFWTFFASFKQLHFLLAQFVLHEQPFNKLLGKVKYGSESPWRFTEKDPIHLSPFWNHIDRDQDLEPAFNLPNFKGIEISGVHSWPLLTLFDHFWPSRHTFLAEKAAKKRPENHQISAKSCIFWSRGAKFGQFTPF